MAMVSRSLMERCSPEGRWRPAAATTTAVAFGGSSPERRRQPGGGGGPWGSGPWPPFFLGDGAGMEDGIHLTAVALEDENSWYLMT